MGYRTKNPGAVRGVSFFVAGKSIIAAADFSGDHQADVAVYDAPSAHWVIDSQMNAPGPVPVASIPFGNPPNDIPVMTIPAMLW